MENKGAARAPPVPFLGVWLTPMELTSGPAHAMNATCLSPLAIPGSSRSTTSATFRTGFRMHFAAWQPEAAFQPANCTLYRDLDETIIDVQRPIILNGIAEFATRGDLLDRSIVISLPTLAAEKRRDEAEFRSAFDSAKAKIFGALLHVLSRALGELPHVRLPRKPRMADFALFGVAVERAIGWPPGTFITAYETNRAAANSSAVEA